MPMTDSDRTQLWSILIGLLDLFLVVKMPIDMGFPLPLCILIVFIGISTRGFFTYLIPKILLWISQIQEPKLATWLMAQYRKPVTWKIILLLPLYFPLVIPVFILMALGRAFLFIPTFVSAALIFLIAQAPGLTLRSTRTQPLRSGFINHRAASVAPVSFNR